MGDLAETVALLWPDQESATDEKKPSLSKVVSILRSIQRKDAVPQLSDWMNELNVSERWSLLKLATGGMRVGIARLVRVSFAQAYDKNVSEIEQIWPFEPPYATLFDWLEGAEKPDAAGRAVFHPVMLAAPIDEKTLCSLNLEDWQIEWNGMGPAFNCLAEEGVRLFTLWR